MKAGRYLIVGYTSAHLPELTDLWIAAWAKAMPAIDFEARRGWFVDHLSGMRERGVTVLCAFDVANGEMAGFITLDRAIGHIDQLAIGPAAWGRGAAVALLNEVKRISDGRLYLDVNQDNARAVRFYVREGFRCVSSGTNASSGLKTWRCEWSDSGGHS